ncbi:MAG: hypothetical protein L0332_31215 [Chloroflexi bacterium]|nr:hypothetical protein [Chloroflexota bacterium]MCI0578700.1 hypothetical protein [Chloroflexota bacterium]MCI0648360.1 hypothetical protein [Chloroflexota bacterium]MCI0731172.1 hypothetical protein [Chloroflexota bacterium]
MKSRRTVPRLLLLGGLLAMLLLAAGLLNAGPLATTIDRWVIAGGGGTATNGNVTLESTIAQPVTGIAASGNSQLCAGFWCGAGSYPLYLPVIRKSP